MVRRNCRKRARSASWKSFQPQPAYAIIFLSGKGLNDAQTGRVIGLVGIRKRPGSACGRPEASIARQEPSSGSR
jgi:hypothetical protein